MTDIEGANSESLSPEEAQAKATILAECENLAAAAVRSWSTPPSIRKALPRP
jgi:hypothetical protein